MGFPGRAGAARAAASAASHVRGATGGMKPGRYSIHADGSVTKIPPKKKHKGGARMPRIVYEILRDNMETMRAARMAMMANAVHGGSK